MMEQGADDGEAKEDVSKDSETGAVLGAAFEVHNILGHGFLEAVYQDALEEEFRLRKVLFVREQSIPITYKGLNLSASYRADFVCFGSVLIELKAIKALGQIEHAQVLHYLKATGLKRALLLNFGTPRLEYRRIVRGYE